MTIYKTVNFESAHCLEGHPKCGKLHGHSYKAEVWITSENLYEKWNFVLDFHNISDYFKAFDHSDVIIAISCEEMVENAVRYFKSLFPDKVWTKVKVRIWETPTSYAEDVK